MLPCILSRTLFKLSCTIDDDLDKQFRDAVAKRLGMKKGNIKKAIEEAMRDWIDRKALI